MKNLLDIKKASKTVSELVTLNDLKKYGIECYFENASKAISFGNSRSEIIDSLKKDVSKTATMIFKTIPIALSIKDGIVTEFDSAFNKAEEVFGNSWDSNLKTVTICGINLSKRRLGSNPTPSKIEIEEFIYKNSFGLDRKEVINTLKAVRVYEGETDDLKRAILYPSISSADKIIKTIADADIKFTEAREKMTFEERAEFDITFKRTGIDGVIQNSTYIDISGIKQLAPSHKRANAVKVSALFEKGLKYIEAIEVDGDGDLDKIIVFIKQIEKLTINTKRKFTLKIRKLGNYKARGLFMHNGLIVAEDIRDTSALLHEVAHLVHIDHLFNNDFVNMMIDWLKPKVCVPEELKSKTAYFTSPKEVIARALEIAGLFKQELDGSIQGEEEFNLIKERSFYELQEGIYFNFNSFSDAEKKDMLRLYKLFYETSPEDIYNSEINNFVKIDTCYRKKEKALSFADLLNRERRIAKKEKKALFAMVTSENIEIIVENKGDVTILELASSILTNVAYLGNHKDRMTVSDWAEVIKSKAKVIKFLLDNVRHQYKNDIGQYVMYLSDIKKAGIWSRIKSEILLGGFRPTFARELRKSVEFCDEFLWIKEFSKNVMTTHPAVLIDQILFKDEKFMLSLLASHPSALYWLNHKKDSNYDIDMLIKYNQFVADAFSDLSEQFRSSIDSSDIMKEFLERDISNIKFASSVYKSQADNMIGYCKMKGSSLSEVPQHHFADSKFLEEILPFHPNAIELAPDMIKQKLKKTNKKVEKTTKKVKPTKKETKSKSELDYESLIKNGEMKKFKHTKTGEMLDVLILNETLSKDDFKLFNKYLKSNSKGYYSRYAKGFVMTIEAKENNTVKTDSSLEKQKQLVKNGGNLLDLMVA